MWTCSCLGGAEIGSNPFDSLVWPQKSIIQCYNLFSSRPDHFWKFYFWSGAFSSKGNSQDFPKAEVSHYTGETVRQSSLDGWLLAGVFGTACWSLRWCPGCCSGSLWFLSIFFVFWGAWIHGIFFPVVTLSPNSKRFDIRTVLGLFSCFILLFSCLTLPLPLPLPLPFLPSFLLLLLLPPSLLFSLPSWVGGISKTTFLLGDLQAGLTELRKAVILTVLKGCMLKSAKDKDTEGRVQEKPDPGFHMCPPSGAAQTARILPATVTDVLSGANQGRSPRLVVQESCWGLVT